MIVILIGLALVVSKQLFLSHIAVGRKIKNVVDFELDLHYRFYCYYFYKRKETSGS